MLSIKWVSIAHGHLEIQWFFYGLFFLMLFWNMSHSRTQFLCHIQDNPVIKNKVAIKRHENRDLYALKRHEIWHTQKKKTMH